MFREKKKMFKLTRINSARLFLSIIVILPSLCVSSTLLLDPLSPGEFPSMFAIDYVECVCNQFESIEITEMIVLLCAHFMHRFRMLHRDVSLENTFNVAPSPTYTHINLSYFMGFLFYTRTEYSSHVYICYSARSTLEQQPKRSTKRFPLNKHKLQ